MTENKNIIQVENLHHTYADGTKALRGIEMKVKKGERLVILGENGSGKSTLFLHLNGVLKPTEGRIIMEGRPLDYSRKGLLDLRRKVGIVFQNPDNQLFSASVHQEISFGVLNLGFSEEEAIRKVDQVMESLQVDIFQDKPTHLLSGGQKKRVAIADIVVMEPDIIIFDEPTSELDPYHARHIDQIIDSLSAMGITVILSTHNVDRALAFADRVMILHQGKVIGQGDPVEIFKDQDLLDKTHLEVPKVLKVFNCLLEAEVLSPDLEPPRTDETLEKYISQLKDKKGEKQHG